MVERIPTWTSHANASISESRGLQMLSTSAPYRAMSLPIAPPRDDMTHSQCADAIEGKITACLERDRVALANFLHRDQWHFREDLFVLGFATKFLVRPHHR